MATFTQTLSHSQPSSKYFGYRLLSQLMRSIGCSSDSIALGFRRGFDSGEMMNRIYANQASGRWGIGYLIDRFYLNQAGCHGLRQRKALLKAILGEVIQSLAHETGTEHGIHVVDIASGPGTYLVELCAELRKFNLSALCRDLDGNALTVGQGLAIKHNVTAMRFAQGNALDADSLSAINPKPDVVVSSGFYELLNDDAMIQRSMALVRHVLQPRYFVFTTQTAHPQLKLIANTLPNRDGELWVMKNRDVAQLEQWARAAGFSTVLSKFTPNRLYAVTRCEA